MNNSMVSGQQAATPLQNMTALQQNMTALQWDTVGAIWALAPLFLAFAVLSGLQKVILQALQPETLKAGAEVAKIAIPAAAGAALLAGGA